MVGSTSTKVCVICGSDCSTGPRIKDATGRYYCTPCHQTAVKNNQVRAAAMQAPPPIISPAAIEALPAAMPRRVASRPSRPWPVVLIAGGLLVLLLVGVAIMLVLRWTAPPPLVGPPSTFNHARVSFQYPQQWTIAEYPSLGPGEVDVTIEAGEDSYVRIFCEPLAGRLDLTLATMVDDVQVTLADPYYGDKFSSWGNFSGDGKSLEGQLHGKPVTCRMFVSQLDSSHVLRIVEICPDADERALRTGFALIRKSCAVH